jgi:D-alanine-D-alanine ligase
MGGTSCEREISLMSGQNVLDALLRKNIDAYAIDVDEKNIIQQLQTNKPDRAFITLHGTNGEDGIIQSLCEILEIPYTGSNVAASALTMDKYRCNLFWKSLGLPILPSVLLNEYELNKNIFLNPRLRGDDGKECGDDDRRGKVFSPVVRGNESWCVKPVQSGSSCGISKIKNISQLPAAYKLAKQYDSRIMIEPWIEGREFTVGILGDEALPIIELTTPEDHFYDYEAKYFSEKTGYIIPCDLSIKEQKKLQDITLQAFKLAGCSYWGRADFVQDKKGQFWLLEVNTIPGLTTHSLVPMAAKHIGIDFDELIVKILEFTLSDTK